MAQLYTEDEEMKYDIKYHRYILTPDAIESEYGISLAETLITEGAIAPEEIPQKFLNRVSKVLYNFIYSWARDTDATLYVLSQAEYRDEIKECLLELAYYMILNNKDNSLDVGAKEYIPIGLKNTMLAKNLLFRGTYINLPNDYIDGKGTDY